MTKHLTSLLACCLLFLAPQAHALKSDRDQPMDIVADRVDVDDNSGVSTFRGNVQVTRGSLHMSGDVIIVRRNSDGELQSMDATGKPAMYRQRPDNKPNDVIAHASEINYNARTDIVILKVKAKVDQGNDSFSGEHLVYNANLDKVTGQGGGGENAGRVRVRLQPKGQN